MYIIPTKMEQTPIEHFGDTQCFSVHHCIV